IVAKQHDHDERYEGKQPEQRGALGGDAPELRPEAARAPRVEREPPLDAVGDVSALSQLEAQIVDFGGGHGPEYSIGPGVVASTNSMDSTSSDEQVATGNRQPRSRLTKFLSGTLLPLSVGLLSLKAPG